MKTTPRKPDRSRIDLTDETVVRGWVKKLGRTREEIAAAIAKVGDNAQAIRKELGCETEKNA
jgi:hypothetical protein